jgi:hypothetical protein
MVSIRASSNWVQSLSSNGKCLLMSDRGVSRRDAAFYVVDKLRTDQVGWRYSPNTMQSEFGPLASSFRAELNSRPESNKFNISKSSGFRTPKSASDMR